MTNKTDKKNSKKVKKTRKPIYTPEESREVKKNVLTTIILSAVGAGVTVAVTKGGGALFDKALGTKKNKDI